MPSFGFVVQERLYRMARSLIPVEIEELASNLQSDKGWSSRHGTKVLLR